MRIRSILLAAGLTITLSSCSPFQAVEQTTIREERRVSREIVQALDAADRTLAVVASQVSTVGSEATSTLKKAQEPLNQITTILTVVAGMLAAYAASHGYAAWTNKPKTDH